MQNDVQTEQTSVEQREHVVEQVISVEPVAEGPRMRIKKPLTEAQLEALRKGREKLAEKRKAAGATEDVKKEDDADVSDVSDVATTTDADDSRQEESESEPDDYQFTYCSIM
jgi:hypothetical protein